MLSRYLLRVLHFPLLVKTGLRNWNKKTVPVGRSFMRLPTPVNVFSLVPFLLDVDEEELLDAPIIDWECVCGKLPRYFGNVFVVSL